MASPDTARPSRPTRANSRQRAPLRPKELPSPRQARFGFVRGARSSRVARAAAEAGSSVRHRHPRRMPAPAKDKEAHRAEEARDRCRNEAGRYTTEWAYHDEASCQNNPRRAEVAKGRTVPTRAIGGPRPWCSGRRRFKHGFDDPLCTFLRHRNPGCNHTTNAGREPSCFSFCFRPCG